MLRRIALLASIGLLAACAASSPTPAPSNAPSAAIASVSPTAEGTRSAPPPTPISTPSGPFSSKLYGYTLTSPEWTGTATSDAWDGTSAPGDGDPVVDTLHGPSGARAWAYGGSTKDTLEAFAARSRETNATVHACPIKPTTTVKATIDGTAAIVDGLDCGVLALTAYVVRRGRATVFFTYGQMQDGAALRAGFDSLLKAVSLE